MILSPKNRAFFNELVQLTKQENLHKGKILHATIIKAGSFHCIYISNCFINFYAKCGQLLQSILVFQNIKNKDVVSWNCLINGFSQKGLMGSSLFVMQLFQRMRAENVLPNSHTFSGVFTSAASDISTIHFGNQVHGLAIKTDSFSDVFVGSSLLNLYCKAGLLSDARKLFDKMPERNSVSWATMISGYAMQRLAPKAVELLELMRREDRGDEYEFLFTSVLSALVLPEFVDCGRQIHCLSIKNGLLVFVPVGNALLTMYAKCNSLDDAFRVFESSHEKSSITWSAMITGCAQCGDSVKALKLFCKMHTSGIKPSKYTLVGFLNACSDIASIEVGKQGHTYSLKIGLESQIFIMSALVDMYAKCGYTTDARKGFSYLQEPDIVLWTSMIAGHVQNGENEEALDLYCKMQRNGISPNELTMSSILKSCASLAGLELGKQMHAGTIKYGLCLGGPVGSALSTMYGKCGHLGDANLVFTRLPERDISSWNAMISGLSQNGHGDEALELFNKMILEGTTPNYVSFVNILSACSHMGSVNLGRMYFKMMPDKFNIDPGLEHYACMVDILSRGGQLNEAKEFIESAKIDHGMCLWRILLSACRNYRHHELGAYAGEKLMELGSQESSAYVLLSSIYTSLGRLEDVERVRKLMKLRGVSKEPGCSWIEVKSRVHVFVVGDEMHGDIEEIRETIGNLVEAMKDERYDKPAIELPLLQLF